eukprot:CAMPEP_0116829214 /NCGR_PEP_ID=MMETSP0418-20121206/4076_1 /TAXON_ID=1158023 /ORGANISM="Astrosyne radiata, Strain 13vi08-1A" /LENGTH=502 /DNA_ID=CAMNT_0004458167 /DNA_START=1 /DNA_END=1509 /DNA_ORIENTATION=+
MPSKRSEEPKIALFDVNEIELGEKIGSGAFSNVYEIKSFRPIENGMNANPKRSCHTTRRHLTRHALREETGKARYAAKFLKQELILEDSDAFENAARDLEREASMMASIDHRNILKVRGLACNGIESYAVMGRSDGFFVIFDRLQETLAERINLCQVDFLKTPGSREFVDIANKRLLRQLIHAEQLKFASDIAGALEYLHHNRVVYRDLKPDNIGLDHRGETKLFDFGFARELPEGSCVTDEEFEMSGQIGTARYMAPEIYRREPYNEKSDVYSFAHVLWETLTFERPYDGYSIEMHEEQVIDQGDRPMIDPMWPLAIQELLERAWHPDIAERPSMTEVRAILLEEIANSKSAPEVVELVQAPRRRRSMRGSAKFSLAMGEETAEQTSCKPRRKKTTKRRDSLSETLPDNKPDQTTTKQKVKRRNSINSTSSAQITSASDPMIDKHLKMGRRGLERRPSGRASFLMSARRTKDPNLNAGESSKKARAKTKPARRKAVISRAA